MRRALYVEAMLLFCTSGGAMAAYIPQPFPGIVNITATSYTAGPTDRYICVKPTAPTTITLVPSPYDGQIQEIQDCTGAFNAHNVDVVPSSGTIQNTYADALLTVNNQITVFQWHTDLNSWIIVQ